jgi:hypothetical protein
MTIGPSGGLVLLRDPALNKGTAFTERERELLGLRGLLPPHVLSQDEQAERSLRHIRAQPSDLEKFIELISCEPVGVRGVAMASQLIEDRRGPLYRGDAASPLSVTAFEALVELDRGLRTISASDC